MEQIGMFNAKTHFSEIVDRVVREGRPVTITRRGVPMVDIVPSQERRKTMSRDKALRELERLRDEVPKLSDAEIAELVSEGRR